MKPTPAADEFATVERRIEMRRAELARRYDEVREGVDIVVAKASRSWPLIAIGGGLAVGYAMSRAGRRPAALQYATIERSVLPSRDVVYAAPEAASSRWMRGAAAVLGLAAMIARMATSGEARALFGAYRAFRARRASL